MKNITLDQTIVDEPVMQSMQVISALRSEAKEAVAGALQCCDMIQAMIEQVTNSDRLRSQSQIDSLLNFLTQILAATEAITAVDYAKANTQQKVAISRLFFVIRNAQIYVKDVANWLADNSAVDMDRVQTILVSDLGEALFGSNPIVVDPSDPNYIEKWFDAKLIELSKLRVESGLEDKTPINVNDAERIFMIEWIMMFTRIHDVIITKTPLSQGDKSPRASATSAAIIEPIVAQTNFAPEHANRIPLTIDTNLADGLRMGDASFLPKGPRRAFTSVRTASLAAELATATLKQLTAVMAVGKVYDDTIALRELTNMTLNVKGSSRLEFEDLALVNLVMSTMWTKGVPGNDFHTPWIHASLAAIFHPEVLSTDDVVSFFNSEGPSAIHKLPSSDFQRWAAITAEIKSICNTQYDLQNRILAWSKPVSA